MTTIEDWLNRKTQNFSEDSKILFEESLLCYRIKAYRASLLFSYLGFLTFIKELIIKSKKPETFDEGRWELLVRCLNNEDEWEEKVYKELTNSKNPLFNISEALRLQIKYWK